MTTTKTPTLTLIPNKSGNGCCSWAVADDHGVMGARAPDTLQLALSLLPGTDAVGVAWPKVYVTPAEVRFGGPGTTFSGAPLTPDEAHRVVMGALANPSWTLHHISAAERPAAIAALHALASEVA